MAQTKFNSSLEVSSTVTIGAGLNVTGTTTFNDQVAIVATNDTVSIVATGVSITASTTITGAVTINGDTNVTGTVTLTGGTFAVNGDVTVTGTITCNALQLRNGSDKLTEILTNQVQYEFGTIAGNSVATHNVTVAGATLGVFNAVLVDTPDILADPFLIDAVVVADDTVSLKLHNTSNGSAIAITATFDIVVFQFA